MAVTGETFQHGTLGRTGIPVFRLGLSTTYRPGKRVFFRAVDLGINMFFGYGVDSHLIKPFREVLATDRERFVLVTGAYNLLFGHPDIGRTLEKRLRQFRTDYIDVFLFLGIMRPSEFPLRTREAMLRLRDSGKVRSVGVSCHDRAFLGELAKDGDMDVLMLRYNAAHRGAESSIFPHLAAHSPGVISYTATRWGQLTRPPRHGPPPERVPSAADCYRFVLSNPEVHATLTAPSNARQLEENVKAMSLGPLVEDEMQFMRAYGDRIRGQRRRLA